MLFTLSSFLIFVLSRIKLPRKFSWQGELRMDSMYLMTSHFCLHQSSLTVLSSLASCEPSISSSSQTKVSRSFQCNLQSHIAPLEFTVPLNTLDLWHCRLGHPSLKIVKFILCNCNIFVPNKMQFSFSLACCYGKIHKFPLSSSETVYNQPLQLIQSDLWGPSPVQSSNGYHYYIHFVDAYPRFAWIYLLKHKLDAFQAFLNFKAQVELQLGFKIKAIQTDWGGEYQAFTNFLTSNGIVHRYSYPYTHEQNGLSERRQNHC